MAVFNKNVFNPKVFNTDYVSKVVVGGKRGVRRRLYKPLRIVEPPDVMEAYGLYLQFKILVGD